MVLHGSPGRRAILAVGRRKVRIGCDQTGRGRQFQEQLPHRLGEVVVFRRREFLERQHEGHVDRFLGGVRIGMPGRVVHLPPAALSQPDRVVHVVLGPLARLPAELRLLLRTTTGRHVHMHVQPVDLRVVRRALLDERRVRVDLDVDLPDRRVPTRVGGALHRVPPPLRIRLAQRVERRYREFLDVPRPQLLARHRPLIVVAHAPRADGIVLVNAQMDVRDLAGNIVQPRAPQMHVGQQAGQRAFEIVGQDMQRVLAVDLYVDTVGRQVRPLDVLDVIRQFDDLDRVVLDLAVGGPAGWQEPVVPAVDAEPRERLSDHGADLRHHERQDVRPVRQRAGVDALAPLPDLIAVEVDPGVQPGPANGAAGAVVDVDGGRSELARRQRRDERAVLVVVYDRTEDVQVVPRGVAVRLPAGFAVGLVEVVAQPRAGDHVVRTVVNFQRRVARRQLRIRCVAPVHAIQQQTRLQSLQYWLD